MAQMTLDVYIANSCPKRENGINHVAYVLPALTCAAAVRDSKPQGEVCDSRHWKRNSHELRVIVKSGV